jgi:rubrerythrin
LYLYVVFLQVLIAGVVKKLCIIGGEKQRFSVFAILGYSEKTHCTGKEMPIGLDACAFNRGMGGSAEQQSSRKVHAEPEEFIVVASNRGAIEKNSQLVTQQFLGSPPKTILKESTIMDFKGSQTEKNLLAAFAGESQARNRYTFAASVARKEGYEQISAVFQETADNEKEHAQLFFGHLQGGTVEITAAYPAAKTAGTAENLKAAAEGERFEWTMLYPNFGEVAEKEGFKAAANTFRMIAKVEVQHEKRYQKLLANLQQGAVFKKQAPTKWKCRNCGYIHEGAEAPGVCPVCNHPQSYFELQAENY